MSGKDPELSRLGEALSSARSAYAEAKKITDEAKARLNETGSRIQTFNAKITELKKGIDSEYNAMRSERAGGDRDAADEHRSMAQSMQEKLTEIYESKKSCFGELDEARAAFNKALDAQKILRDKVQEAWDGFNARLEYLKEENAKEQAKWKEKPCKICGVPIRYNTEWKHIPNLCKECFDKDKENWEDPVYGVKGDEEELLHDPDFEGSVTHVRSFRSKDGEVYTKFVSVSKQKHEIRPYTCRLAYAFLKQFSRRDGKIVKE